MVMPRYQKTASFEPFEIEAMDETIKQEGFKSFYQLIRRAVLVYVGLELDGRKQENEISISTRSNQGLADEDREFDEPA